MKSLLSLFILIAFTTGLGLAQEKMEKMEKKEVKAEAKVEKVHGYIVDAMCAKGMAGKENTMKKAAAHTRACALEEECAKSGYGVFSGNKWFKFDAAGDQLAKDMLEKSTTEKGIMVDVSGTINEGQLVVASLVEAKMDAKAMEMKSEKKPEVKSEEHKH